MNSTCKKSVFSKNIKPEKHLTKDMFEIEDMVVEGRRSDLVGDEDEDFIGKKNFFIASIAGQLPAVHPVDEVAGEGVEVGYDHEEVG